MEELLNAFKGKKVDINCAASCMFRGEIHGTDRGVLELEDEDHKIFYIAVDRIIAVCEAADQATKPGFIG